MSLISSPLRVCMEMDSTSDQHHQWLQATMHENALMDSSSSPPGTDMLGPSQILMSERRLRPPQDQALKCPRCDSTHTKFCYYNNYSLSQPRYFCKTCRRYWTKGGTLRNIPVGGGYRKNRKSSSSNKKISSNETLSVSSSIINNQSPNPNPNAMMMMSLPNPADLQLSLPYSQLIGRGHEYGESMLFDKSIPTLESSSRLIRPIDLCMGYKQPVAEAVLTNENTFNSNNYGGNFSTQFPGRGSGGYDMQNNGGYVDIGLSSYIEEKYNNSNTNDSGAQYQLRDEYYSGLREHHHHHKDIIQMHREAKPNPKMLDLEWQQEEVGCPNENRMNSKQESFGGYDIRGSWWGSASLNAGNIYQHQMLFSSATTSNNSLH